VTKVTIVTHFPGYGRIFYLNGQNGEKIKFSGGQKRVLSSLCVTIVTFASSRPYLEHYIYKLVTIVTMSEDMVCKAKILFGGIWGSEKVTILKKAFVTYRHFFLILAPLWSPRMEKHHSWGRERNDWRIV